LNNSLVSAEKKQPAAQQKCPHFYAHGTTSVECGLQQRSLKDNNNGAVVD